MQAEINIGTFGHVDHGKTTLTKALTGKWTDTHSEEIKRGISIRLGYADVLIHYCKDCDKYLGSKKCKCGKKTEIKRKISLVDSPGHETLMTTVIAASSIIDGALFLIAANEPCPQAQTIEHLIILNAIGMKDIIVVQTKIDLVSKERALEHKKEIEKFLNEYGIKNAPIIPVIGTHDVNISEIFEAIEKKIPTPKRDRSANPRFYVSRSFDVNKPGTEISKLQGGVLGGSLNQGILKIGDIVELLPGIENKGKLVPITFKIISLRSETEELAEVGPGGLIALGTELDPALTKSDMLVGSVIGLKGKLPEVSNTIKIKYTVFERKDIVNPLLKENEIVVVSIHSATAIGIITALSKGIATIKLKRVVCVDKGSKAALSRKIGQRWRLSGWGDII